MKKLIVLAIGASFISFSAASQATEHCPELKKIEEAASGVYRADGVNGEWSGVLQGIVAERTPVQSFKMALAIQENASGPIKLQYCTYGVGPDKTLDMRFITKNEKDFSIQTEGNNWKTEPGPFGLIYNVCEKTSPENCKFTVHQ
ncbi:DUF3757 domain-containing protein [Yersinia mollaretii]|uniref:DUF3757 domain-containing protein n=1 Tax=Yersinia mollaretii TaxID=33060 RepID=A0AA44CIP7_YERMO|nr:DUF3757 domain-containing protein [Yersinia mollaretii]NIL21439.1 DUF3757 domain-containing protein [Yersinia mollaretii]CNI83564.1 Protein of uncharacterised function (DUF3757) [Yersinia mollaretii]CNK72689.1 Protein of uncharacterised function (DUF3757) [Yersinia enterocolitica]CQR07382.1 Protein of uncharacterised function (DUF3757) [Yersinia mollaretii]